MGFSLIVVVDAANVMGSRPDGWWRDRAGAGARLYGDLVRVADLAVGDEVAAYVLVLEGAARRAAVPAAVTALSSEDAVAVGPGSVGVLLADGSGDDAIVAVVAVARRLDGNCMVVTADRELRRRCAGLGATVAGPGWLLARFRAR
ncbi:MAG TPA: hypothetical protein VKU39_19670 [Streptosporangiaceae bacterium]|nr:hypothetical protein [Streptosporangiaceae bacterium]